MPPTKSQVPQRPTIRIEGVGSVELGGITLSRGQQQHNRVARGHVDLPDRHVVGGGSADTCDRPGWCSSSPRSGVRTYVLDDDIDPSNTSDVLWALGTRIHPNLRQEHWPVPILPWYQCYSEEDRHGGRGPIVVHDGLLDSIEDGHALPATFDNLYPPEIRERVLAAEPRSTVDAAR